MLSCPRIFVLIIFTLLTKTRASFYGDFYGDDYPEPWDHAETVDETATGCESMDVLTNKKIYTEVGNDVTGDILSDCTIMHCFEPPEPSHRPAGCMVNNVCHPANDEWEAPCGSYLCSKQIDGTYEPELDITGCNDDGQCYSEGDSWESNCSKKKCVRNAEGELSATIIESHNLNEVWTENTEDGCNVYKCAYDADLNKNKVEKNPGCFYKKEQTCYNVGDSKKVVCSVLECKLDASGTTASFKGSIRCFSAGKCVDVGTKWLNEDTCISQTCTKTVDEFRTELHYVEKTPGCTLFGVCYPKGHVFKVNPCSETECGLVYNSYFTYSKRGCFIDGACKRHTETWINEACNTVKCYVSLNKNNGPKVSVLKVASGCRDYSGKCRAAGDQWPEPSMDTCPNGFKATASCGSNHLSLLYKEKC